MTRTAVLAGLLLPAALLLSGCTSFAFKKKGRGTAPSHLQDRSTMVTVPGGTFAMGAQNAEPDEFPPHEVTLATFLIDKTEVTIGAYRPCVEARVCRPPRQRDGDEGRDHPVVGVSWYDARAYCAWVNKRLPTEAEWERAARHPKYAAFPWGPSFEPGRANLRGGADGHERTAPVGSFPTGATSTGALDLVGNAAEWVSDAYEATYYKKSTKSDPTGPEGRTGSKVFRGGSWADNDYLARGTARNSADPNVSNDAIGFRCAAR